MTEEIDRDKLRAAIRRMGSEYIFYMQHEAITLLSQAQLRKLIRQYLKPEDLRPDGKGKGDLLAAVQAFRQASLAGEYLVKNTQYRTLHFHRSPGKLAPMRLLLFQDEAFLFIDPDERPAPLVAKIATWLRLADIHSCQRTNHDLFCKLFRFPFHDRPSLLRLVNADNISSNLQFPNCSVTATIGYKSWFWVVARRRKDRRPPTEVAFETGY